MVNVKRLELQLSKKGLSLPAQVVKRDGSIVAFDLARIEKAVEGCYSDLPADVQPETPAGKVAEAVGKTLASRAVEQPTVEAVQDLVEVTLLTFGEVDAARAYIRYRDEHSQARATRVPDEVRAVFAADSIYFPTQLQQFQYLDKYAKFSWDAMRRETWVETTDRTVDHLEWLVQTYAPHALERVRPVLRRIHGAILEQRAMPSMRLLSMAGEPARRNGLALYNCSYQTVDCIDAFAEALLISMAGCGVGYSVERQYVEQFPRILRQSGVTSDHWVEDTTEGWAEAVRFGLSEWWAGRDVTFHYDLIRPAGTVLKTKGGRASGPGPLKTALDVLRATVLKRQGSYLRTVDAHDMMCVIGGAAVAGGVRRTAMIALFSWDDREMRDCKNGAWGTWPAYRENANNSAVWPDDLSQVEVMEQMLEMAKGGRGEPGIFSRSNAKRTRPARRSDAEFGTNPCGEINLRPQGLCNLSIAVARPGDTREDLIDKVQVASLIGTIQSLSTHFPGMRPEWEANAKDERLLGVDITGQRDCALLSEDYVDAAGLREQLKDEAVAANEWLAGILGINPAAAVTCDKPSGNSSQLLNTASGIHARWAPYYLRRTRVSATSALFRVLKTAGVPMTPENGQTVDNATTWVVAWPVKAPEGVKTRKDFTAVEQCEFWLLNKLHWTEHNPSVTITYQPHELLEMTSWVWEHRDLIGGMAFLPADDAAYMQAPYEEVTQEQHEAAAAAFPAEIDYSLIYAYEQTDMTTAAQELACLAGACDV